MCEQVPWETVVKRMDWETRQQWEECSERFKECAKNAWEGITAIDAKCKEYGIALGSLASKLNFLWELEGFDTTRQLLVDFFHVLAEGSGNLFYELFKVWSPQAKEIIVAAMHHPDTWHPLARKLLLAPLVGPSCF